LSARWARLNDWSQYQQDKNTPLFVFLFKASKGSFHHDLTGKQMVVEAEAPPSLDIRAKISVLRTSLSSDATRIPYIVTASVGENLQPKKMIEESLSLPEPKPWFCIEKRYKWSIIIFMVQGVVSLVEEWRGIASTLSDAHYCRTRRLTLRSSRYLLNQLKDVGRPYIGDEDGLFQDLSGNSALYRVHRVSRPASSTCDTKVPHADFLPPSGRLSWSNRDTGRDLHNQIDSAWLKHMFDGCIMPSAVRTRLYYASYCDGESICRTLEVLVASDKRWGWQQKLKLGEVAVRLRKLPCTFLRLIDNFLQTMSVTRNTNPILVMRLEASVTIGLSPGLKQFTNLQGQKIGEGISKWSRNGNKKDVKHTAAGIPTWSPTVVLICRSTAYVWQSGRDAQFSADCGR
ncbi:hypothetical protein KCU98_g278, partial [Aureobasidium melanogenum]